MKKGTACWKLWLKIPKNMGLRVIGAVIFGSCELERTHISLAPEAHAST